MRSDLRVLVADDNEHNRLLLEAVLNAANIEPAFAMNGQEAVDAAELAAFDLILMDVNMPVMDGLTAARLIRKIEERRHARRAHLVVVSCNSERGDVRVALSAGADRHLAKPFQIADVLEIAKAATQRLAGGIRRRTPIQASGMAAATTGLARMINGVARPLFSLGPGRA